MSTTELSPASTAVDAESSLTAEHEWRPHELAALMLKVAAFAVPVIASIVWTIIVGNLLPEPSGFAGHVLWWFIVAGGALVVALLLERFARRLLPMAVLLKLALVFPETAPSRFAMALRANSTRQLKRRIESGVVNEDSTPQSAATALLELSAALSVHDRMTRGHAERVRAYSVMIGQQLELERDDLQKLQWSALLHDVGKLDVSAEILNKPAAPDAEELKSLRAHPERGAEFMEPLEEWLGGWALAASQHHERFDGGGYPSGLSEDEISLSARIVAVADAYDVMTSTRSYKTAMDPQVARTELLQCSSTQFDPDVVRAFLSVPISELRRPFQAALGAGLLASVAQIVDLRTIATGGAAVAGAVGATLVGGSEPPAAIAFSEATPTTIEVMEDSPIDIPLSTSIEADSYSLDSVDGPATASIDNDILRLEPKANESGTVTVVVTACNEDACDTTSIVAEVISVNDPPAAGADEATTSATMASISIPVLANDTDVDDPDLLIRSAEVATGAGKVSVIESGQQLLFTPDPGSIGPWTIEYVVTDTGDGFDRGVVTILDGDLAPEARDDTASVVGGESILIDVRANDEDDGGPDNLDIVHVEIVDPPESLATIEVDLSGQLLFSSTPESDVVIVEYTVRDRMLRESSARVLIAVTPPVPVAVDDQASTKEDTPVTVSVLDNDGPALLDLSTVDMRIVSSSSGLVEVAGGEITYTPPPNASGTAAIVYEICSAEATCDQASLTIVVEPVSDPSPFAAEGQIVLPSNAGPQLVPWVVVSSGQTTVEPGTTFSISTDRPNLFSVAPAISPNGGLTFTPAPGASGTANSTVTVIDSNGRRLYRLDIHIR